MRQTGEPSVEEILASIKKVIARDNRAVAEEAQRERADQGVVRTVSFTAPAEPDRAAPPRAESAYDEDDEVLDLGEAAELADEGADDEAPLLPPTTRSSISESLAALAMMAEPGAQPQIVRSGETSLEGLTRELLRPALAEWLDKNLPALVERMVAAEIARIVGKKA